MRAKTRKWGLPAASQARPDWLSLLALKLQEAVTGIDEAVPSLAGGELGWKGKGESQKELRRGWLAPAEVTGGAETSKHPQARVLFCMQHKHSAIESHHQPKLVCALSWCWGGTEGSGHMAWHLIFRVGTQS